MGCDIHLYVEKLNKENGLWEAVIGKSPQIGTYRGIASSMRERGNISDSVKYEEMANALESGEAEKEWLESLAKTYPPEKMLKDAALRDEYESELRSDHKRKQVYHNWLYDGRNYDLFAMLADVRNGRGFAGIKTGEGFNPISDPKGLPSDVSGTVLKASEEWGDDGHSRSHLTLLELLDYDWDQATSLQGVVSSDEYKTFKQTGRPDSYAGGVGGGNVAHVSNEEMDAILEGEKHFRQPLKDYYTTVVWDMSYRDCAESFYNESIPKLQEMGNADEVRIVFWFDN